MSHPSFQAGTTGHVFRYLGTSPRPALHRRNPAANSPPPHTASWPAVQRFGEMSLARSMN
jgi:hypothetical protein